jgi:hypothetical protein
MEPETGNPKCERLNPKSQILNPVFHDPKHHIKIYQGDCLEILAAIPADCVDLIFADPPYFLSNGGITCHAGRMVSVNKGEWDRSRGPDANHEFNRYWLGGRWQMLLIVCRLIVFTERKSSAWHTNARMRHFFERWVREYVGSVGPGGGRRRSWLSKAAFTGRTSAPQSAASGTSQCLT